MNLITADLVTDPEVPTINMEIEKTPVTATPRKFKGDLGDHLEITKPDDTVWFSDVEYLPVRKGRTSDKLQRQTLKFEWFAGQWYAPAEHVNNPLFKLK